MGSRGQQILEGKKTSGVENVFLINQRPKGYAAMQRHFLRLNYCGPRATEQDGGMSKITKGQQALTKEKNYCQITTKC